MLHRFLILLFFLYMVKDKVQANTSAGILEQEPGTNKHAVVELANVNVLNINKTNGVAITSQLSLAKKR